MGLKHEIKMMLPVGIREAIDYAKQRDRMRRHMGVPREAVPLEIARWFEEETGQSCDLADPRTQTRNSALLISEKRSCSNATEGAGGPA